jgi:hypothetical protein
VVTIVDGDGRTTSREALISQRNAKMKIQGGSS